MNKINGLISLDTFLPRQHTITTHIKPIEIPYIDVLGVREADTPADYMLRNQELLESYKSELVEFLAAHPQSALVMNYYFGILPEIRAFIQENQANIAKILVVTCQDDFYEKHAQPNNYPIKPTNVITYSDDRRRREEDVATALER